MKMEIDYEQFFNEPLEKNTTLYDAVFDKEEIFFSSPQVPKHPQNCKSNEAEYILANGSVSDEYLKLKGEADARYINLKTRLSSDI